ncbi:MAG: ribonuclease H-like domain-containing protein [Vicinamibacterales bacterium]
MNRLTERLRGVIEPAAPRARPVAHDHSEILGGEQHIADGHAFLIVDRRYPGGHRHGRVSVLDSLPPDSGVWPRMELLAGRQIPTASDDDRPRRLMFFDLETTGLAGGAGTYAFLVGCGWFEGAAFRVRQFLLSSFGAERGILKALTALAQEAAAVVTFNGKSFDVPLIDTRYALNRMTSPFGDLPHLDMLHVARRFWRQADTDDEPRDEDGTRSRGCRLADLEQTVCGHEREGDVPGFEIPARYFHYVRSGDVSGLEAVLEHNRLDLLSLALLTARASQMLEDGPGEASHAREALGLGTVYERAGCLAEARAAYAHAAAVPGLPGAPASGCLARSDDATQAEALRAYALLARRERRFQDAALAWQCLIEIRRCPPQLAREAAEALAVHHEHRVRDLDVARRFALQSLQYRSTPGRTQAVQHRLSRLERKLGKPAAYTAGLF